MVVVDLVFEIAALEPGLERVGGVGRQLAAEQVQGQREVEIGPLLHRRQVDDAERAHPCDVVRVVDPGLAHRRAGRFEDAADARLADEHVVRFLGQHEPAGARQRVEPRLRQRVQLHLAVAVGEEGEHEEREPIRRRLVERAEQARAVAVARAAAQQVLGLLAPVAAEIFLQQVDHRPQVARLLDIDLEQVAQIVERGRGRAEPALLLDRGGLGVALHGDQPAQHRAVFARHLLPGRLALMRAERRSCGPSTCGASRMPQRYSGIRT